MLNLEFSANCTFYPNLSDDKQYLRLKTSMDEAQRFAYHLLLQWNMGRCGDDLILVYSEEDNVVCTPRNS